MRSGNDKNSARRGLARDQSKLALLAILVAVATWGFSNVAIKAVSTTGLVASFYRLWFAIPPLWLWIGLSPALRRRISREWLRSCLLGGALFGLHQLLFFTSLKLTTVSNVAIIGALQPALVLLVSGPMFGEPTSLRAAVCSAIAFGGTLLVVTGSSGTPGWSPLGDVLAVGNLLAFTGYFLASKQIRRRVGTLEYVVGMTTVAGIVVLVVALSTGQQLASPAGWDWPILVSLAIFPGTLGHLLTNWAHQHTSAFVMSILFLAVPVLASLGAAMFLGEALGASQILGGAIVLAAIGFLVRSTPDETGEELAESAAETDAP